MPETTTATAEKAAEDAKPLEDREFVSQHSVTIGGDKVDYTAKVGRIVLHDDSETAKPKVALFYTAYLRDGVSPVRDRPLVFLWNGGPGSSAIWLHMYSFGPRRITFEGDPLFDTSRWALSDNEHSLLDVADLVFLDPPSTGFSRVAPGEDPTQFHGVDPDAEIVGKFVVEFIHRHHRGDSPIVLLGESYGTLRTPAVTEYLQRDPGFFVDGVVLVSSLMDVSGATFGVGSVLGPIGMLPSYAATAHYHGVLSGDLGALMDEAENFAINEYAPTLLRGSRLGEGELERLAKRMSDLTGLSTEFLIRANLRVNLFRFAKELLRDQRRTVGRLDTRWVGIDSDAAGENIEDDPSMTMIWGPATRALNRYVREDLGWEGDRDLSYRTMKPFPAWKPRESVQSGIWTPQLETATLLRTAINRAPHLQVMLQSGIYDLGTPYFPAELTLDHLFLEPERAKNVSKKRYESGHMIYMHEPSLAQMRADLVAFIKSVRGGVA